MAWLRREPRYVDCSRPDGRAPVVGLGGRDGIAVVRVPWRDLRAGVAPTPARRQRRGRFRCRGRGTGWASAKCRAPCDENVVLLGDEGHVTSKAREWHLASSTSPTRTEPIRARRCPRGVADGGLTAPEGPTIARRSPGLTVASRRLRRRGLAVGVVHVVHGDRSLVGSGPSTDDRP